MRRFLLVFLGLAFGEGKFAEQYLEQVADLVLADVSHSSYPGVQQVIRNAVDISIASPRPYYELNELSRVLMEFRREKNTCSDRKLCLFNRKTLT